MWGSSISSDVQVWRFIDEPEEPNIASFAPPASPSRFAVTDAQVQTWKQSHVAGARTIYVPHACSPRREIGQRIGAVRAPYMAIEDKDQALVVYVYDFVRGRVHQVIDFRTILVSDNPHLVFSFGSPRITALRGVPLCRIHYGVNLVRPQSNSESSSYDITGAVAKCSAFYEDKFPSFVVEKSALQLLGMPRRKARGSKSHADAFETVERHGVISTCVSGFDASPELLVAPAGEEQQEGLSGAIVGPIHRNHLNYTSGAYRQTLSVCAL